MLSFLQAEMARLIKAEPGLKHAQAFVRAEVLANEKFGAKQAKAAGGSGGGSGDAGKADAKAESKSEAKSTATEAKAEAKQQ